MVNETEWFEHFYIPSLKSSSSIVQERKQAVAKIGEDELQEIFPTYFHFKSCHKDCHGPCNLKAIAASSLALFLDQYIDQLGAEVLSILPSRDKALLLTIARSVIGRLT
jgi:hypothetical protein